MLDSALLRSNALHFTLLFSTALHYILPHSTALHCTPLYSTALRCDLLCSTALHYALLCYTKIHHTTLRCALLRLPTLHYAELLYARLFFTMLRYSTLLYASLCYAALRSYESRKLIKLSYAMIHFLVRCKNNNAHTPEYLCSRRRSKKLWILQDHVTFESEVVKMCPSKKYNPGGGGEFNETIFSCVTVSNIGNRSWYGISITHNNHV